MCKDVERRLSLQGVPNDPPIDQIPGVENRQTRNAIEAGSGEIEVVADTNHVRI
jgi:hypothetical protein